MGGETSTVRRTRSPRRRSGATTTSPTLYGDPSATEPPLIKRQNPLDILGDGERIRRFTWVDDVASAISRHSFEPATPGKAINLGNPEPVTIKELAQRIFKKGQEIGGNRSTRGVGI